jgi:hypothetical protein
MVSSSPERDRWLAALDERLDQFAAGDRSALEGDDVSALVASLAALPAGDLEVAYLLGLFHHFRLQVPRDDAQAHGEASAALGYFRVVFRHAPDLVPEQLQDLVRGLWIPDVRDVDTWCTRAQDLLHDPRRFTRPELFSGAIHLYGLALDSGLLAELVVSTTLTGLMLAQVGLFEATDDLTALDRAIEAAARCVDLTASDDLRLPGRRSNLAAALGSRFAQTGVLSDLGRAMTQLWAAVEFADPSERAEYCSNLGGALLLHFRHTGDSASLDEAVRQCQTAVTETGRTDRHRPRMLGTLALALRSRYQHGQDPADLDAAVAAIREALIATPSSHPDRIGYLSALSTALRLRSARTNSPQDADEAVEAAREAAQAAMAQPARRVRCLSNLGAAALSARHRGSGDPTDADAAVLALTDAAGLVAADDPARGTLLANLGLALRQRAIERDDNADRRAAADAYAASAAVETAPSIIRAMSSYDAGMIEAERGDWHAAVHHFGHAVDLLHSVVDPHLARDDQQHRLSRLAGLGPEAAAAALRAGLLRTKRSLFLSGPAACCSPEPCTCAPRSPGCGRRTRTWPKGWSSSAASRNEERRCWTTTWRAPRQQRDVDTHTA